MSLAASGYAPLAGSAPRRRGGGGVPTGAVPTIGSEYFLEPLDDDDGRAPSSSGGGGGKPAVFGGAGDAGGWLFRGVVGCTLASITTMMFVLTVLAVAIVARNYSSIATTAAMLADASNTVATTLTSANDWVHTQTDVNGTTAFEAAQTYVAKFLEIVDVGHGMVQRAEGPFDDLLVHLRGIRGALESSDHQGLIRDIDELSRRLAVLVGNLQDMGITLHIGA